MGTTYSMTGRPIDDGRGGTNQWGAYNQWANGQRNDYARERDQAASDRVDNARDRVFTLADTRLDEVRNDPIDQMILEQLQGRASTDVPYDEATTQNLIAQGNESSAAAYGNRIDHLNRTAAGAGVNVTDPSYIAQQRELKERQTAQNIDNRRRVESTARTANHAAQGTALQQLGGQNAATNARIDNRTDRVIDLNAREIADVADRGPDLPNFNEWSAQNRNPFASMTHRGGGSGGGVGMFGRSY